MKHACKPAGAAGKEVIMKVFRFFRHSHTYRRMFLHTYAQYAAASLLVLLAAGLFLFYQDSHTVRNNTLQAAANLAYYADDRLSACQKLSANVGQSGRLLNLYSNSATDLDFSLLDSTMLFCRPARSGVRQSTESFCGNPGRLSLQQAVCGI